MNNKSALYRYIPFLDWIRSYSGDDLRGDANAGLTVGIMLIPQGMAYAVLAGLPPVYGLYASIVPLIIYALLGTSRHLAVGPVALISLLVLAGISDFAEAGTERFIQLAILTALGVGVVQLLMGLLRMGFMVNFLSHPILAGFTSAAALIIAASQIRNLLGVPLPRSNQLLEIGLALFNQIGDIHLFTTIIGIGSIVAIILIRRWKSTLPASLIVVIITILITYLFDLHNRGLTVVGDIPRGLPSFSLVGFEITDLQMLLPTILVISLISYIESVAVAKAIANKRGYRIDPNQELVALGSANLGGAFFQAYPTAGGFSRTAVNDQANARTGIASVISAGVIALTVLFLTPLFYYLPNAVLAAIIIVAVFGLFDNEEIVHLWKTDRRDLFMLMITFFATLFIGIEEGIAVGVIISLIMVIYSSTQPHSAELGQLGSSSNFRNINRYPEARIEEDVLIFRFDSSLYFANVEHFRDSLQALIEKKGATLKVIILDASAINSIDSTGIHMLKKLVKDLNEREISLYIASAIGPVRDKLKTAGIIELMGQENFFFDFINALAYHHGDFDRKNESPPYSPLQTNR